MPSNKNTSGELRAKKPQARKRSNRKSTGTQKSTGKFKLTKPRVEIKRGQEAREARAEDARQPLSIWGVVIRFLPVWALLIMILILAPTLPFRIIGSVFAGLFSRETVIVEQTAEPLFIVEGNSILPEESDLPPPDWSLEIASFYTPEVQYWAEDIARWSVTYRVRPNIIATLIQIESCGDPLVSSEAGAMGLFQVMPIHFAEEEDPFNSDTSARRGLAFFAEMLASANGDVGLAFAAYNGGPSVFTLSPSEWAAETRYYQFWGSGIYEEAEAGLTQSPTLIEWLDAGGASLCSHAANTLGLD